MPAQRFDQPLFTEFFSRSVEGLGNPVGVEGECVSRLEVALGNGALPLSEQAEHGAGGIEPDQCAIGTKEERRQMSAIRVAQTLPLIIVLGKEEGGVGVVRGILVEELVD